MLTKSQKDLLERLDRQAADDLKHGFNSGALHWQHVRDIAKAGTTHDELTALFRGAFDETVIAALLASQQPPATIEL